MQSARLVFIVVSVIALANGYPQYTQSSEDQTAGKSPVAEDDSDMYMEPIEGSETNQREVVAAKNEKTDDYKADSQQFYPSFVNPFSNPPLGHSRPYFQQEAAYSHRPTAYQQHLGFDNTARFSGYKGESVDGAGAAETHGLLGSGNFGVITGGTFYADNEDADSFDNYNYYNGHGRPSYYFGNNPRPRQYQQFENFRDFADINMPSNPAYSQYVVVYANKNGSKRSPPVPSESGVQQRPKNIMEHLALLDLEETTSEAPQKKLSKSKRKLATLPKEKKPWSRKQKLEESKTISSTTTVPDLYEPLLALS